MRYQLNALIVASMMLASIQVYGNSNDNRKKTMSDNQLELATFGAGCFWCVEAIFQRVEGVEKVVSGYAGGHVKNPSYKEVCQGTTGHAEVCQLSYDPKVVSYEELLEVFWGTHDPTTLNRQGNDVGTQYRSSVFYHTPEQKKLAELYKKELDNAKVYDDPIVTEIVPYSMMYVAENYHQNYFNQNGNQPYCSFVIQPKIDKFQKVFKDKLKN
jgi:peptide-methionine (S)-S-oxide reductase